MPERGLFIHPNADGSATTPAMGRRALAGLLAPAGAYGGRVGVISGMAVSGTSGWSYTVGAGHVATPAGTGEVLVWANGADYAAATSPAPGSGSRIDIVYALHTRRLEGDAASEPVIGVAQGTATTGTPVAPSLPAGGVELARATVPAGATGTAGASLSTANVQYTTGRGAPIPVTGAGQRDAITWGTALNPAVVRMPDGSVQVNRGSGWVTEASPTFTAYTPTVGGVSLGGGGVATGRWARVGNLVVVFFSVTLGSSPSPAGTFTVSLPVLANTVFSTSLPLGRATLLDASSSNRCNVEVARASAGDSVTLYYVSAYPTGSRQAVNATNPWAWANGDSIEGYAIYEAA